MLKRAFPLDRDRSRDQVVLKSGVPIKRVPTPLVRRLAQISTAANADMAAEFDLSAPQYGALSYLFDEPDIDQNGLAARLGIDRTSMGSLSIKWKRRASSSGGRLKQTAA